MRGRHSAKPEEIRDIVRDFFQVDNRLELWARGTSPPDWDCWLQFLSRASPVPRLYLLCSPSLVVRVIVFGIPVDVVHCPPYNRVMKGFGMRRGLEVDGFFSSSEDSVARTSVEEGRRSVGVQTDGIGVERRIAKRATVFRQPAVIKGGPVVTATLPIVIPARSLPLKRAPPSVDDVWKALHTDPPPGKRVTVHKTGCGCFCCKRDRLSSLGQEGQEALAAARPAVVMATARPVDVDQSGEAVHIKQGPGGIA